MTPSATISTPVFVVAGIVKSYAHRTVLHDLNLSVLGGQSVALIGPNGAGKTTLLRIMGGLTRPDSGSVELRDPANAGSTDIRAQIGFVSHSTMLYGSLTVIENLLFNAELFRLPNPQQCAQACLTMLEADQLARRRISELSNGERKRVSIARALMHSPQVVLFDEPEAGLDSHLTAVIQRLITDLRAQDKNIVFTSHSSSFVASCATNIVGIREGRLKVYDTVGNSDLKGLFSEAQAH